MVELRRDYVSSTRLMESIAHELDFTLERTPRVRRRSVGRRSAIDLLNHPKFDAKELEKLYNESEDDDHDNQKRKKQCNEGDELSTLCPRRGSACSYSSLSSNTATTPTPRSRPSPPTRMSSRTMSSFSTEFDKEGKELVTSRTSSNILKKKIKKNKKNSKKDPNEEASSKSKKEEETEKPDISSIELRRTSMMRQYKRRSNSVPLLVEMTKDNKQGKSHQVRNSRVNRELHDKNKNNTNNGRKTEGMEGPGIFQRRGSYGALLSLQVIEMMGNELQSRYEKYREEQKIKETRKMILEAARKRENANLRNLLTNNDFET